MRQAILRLKFETPDHEKSPGGNLRAVVQGGVGPVPSWALESGASADRHFGMDALRTERTDEKPLRRTVAAVKSPEPKAG
ncbi:MAG: hypothetical protein ACLR76_08395 [Alistipes sp.]